MHQIPFSSSSTSQESDGTKITSSLPISDQNDDELYDIEMIQKAIQAQNADATPQPENYIAPRTITEEKIAQIWSELLGRQQIGVNNDLFRMGGDSITALQILARIYQLFQVELSMEIMFTTSFTIAQLSQLVDQQVDELAAILKELDSLSDDEVKALLAKSDEQNEEDFKQG